MGVFQALLFSPVVGFVRSGADAAADEGPDPKISPNFIRPRGADAPPPPWIRGLLSLTWAGCFVRARLNDGQKGMGLIMLILIGAVPTAYALNRAMPDSATPCVPHDDSGRPRKCSTRTRQGQDGAAGPTRTPC